LHFLNQREIFYHIGLQLAVFLSGVGCKGSVLFFDGVLLAFSGGLANDLLFGIMYL
jgi:hypothetical protein